MSKGSDKRLCEYIQILEKLIMNMIENTEIKNNEVNLRIEKLINLLSKRGITPEEIEKVLSINEPYDNNLEILKNDLINESLPQDINNITNINSFQVPMIKEKIKKLIEDNHTQLEKIGISLSSTTNKNMNE